MDNDILTEITGTNKMRNLWERLQHINDLTLIQQCGGIDPVKRPSDASFNMNKRSAEGNNI